MAVNIYKNNFDPDVIWTRNLLIWSQTRYRCATESHDTVSHVNILKHINFLLAHRWPSISKQFICLCYDISVATENFRRQVGLSYLSTRCQYNQNNTKWLHYETNFQPDSPEGATTSTQHNKRSCGARTFRNALSLKVKSPRKYSSTAFVCYF